MQFQISPKYSAPPDAGITPNFNLQFRNNFLCCWRTMFVGTLEQCTALLERMSTHNVGLVIDDD